ncbi:phage tail tape measure protein [Pectobacterium wasabiae]|uniref:Lambda family phage tail tape measure protein n=1 Tax=Pectobacterium wasabiae TaxID=55208 RepID=A0AAW3ENP4_9GAMM|nr:phage tail tape measure protein [Pectobacterium wasabiae]AOR64867.1 phage tail tape measure protein [Pectobacterium wasabiae CFBP 3304]EJS96290.1 Tail length tape measure protein [Pectobacterium wasabiae CFBP 3304]KFX09866.1 lambda family phage tail tape measure protein [Pectobacterium wasabiae]KGA30068.1 lambda family phage tail tape measure protein [Pectobacterium wasabiae]
MATLRELIIKISANSQSFQSEINRASRMGADYYRTMQNGGRQATAAARESQRTFAELNNQFVGIKSAAAGIVGAMSVTSLITMADNWGQVTSRMKMATESSDELAMVQRRLMEISDRTYKPIEEQAELFIRSSNAMKELGYSTAGTIDFIDSISSALTINAASADKGQSAINALSKSMVQGKVSGDEWNTVMEVMPTVIGDIARAMGTTETAVKKLAADSKLSMQQFADAVIAAQQKNAELAENMPTTVGDAVTKLSNHMKKYVGEANSAYGTTQALSGGISSLADNIDTVATAGAALVGIGFARYFGGMASGAYSATAGIISAAKSEVALAEAQLRGTQIAVARARSAVYRAQQALAAARGTDAQAAAEKRLAATQAAVARNVVARTAAQTTLNNVTAVGSRLMSGALGLVGGVPGLLMLGAGAWYYMYQKQEQARRSAQEYASTIDEIRKKSGAMSLADASDNYNKTQSSLSEQNRLIDEQKEKIRLIRVEIEGYQKILANPGLTVGGYMVNHLVSVEDATNGLSAATEGLSVEQDRLSRLQGKAQDIQSVLVGLEYRRSELIKQQTADQNAAYQSLLRMNGQHTEFNRLLSLGNDLLSARQGNASFPFRVPNAKLTDKQTDALEKSRQDLELSKLKGEAKELARLRYSADELGLTDNPANQKSRQDYINNNLDKWRNDEANKPTKKGPKTDEEKAIDNYDRLIKQQREQLALGSSNTELAKIKYQTTQGELSTLTSIQKQELARNAALIDQAEIRKRAAEYENGLIDSNANAKAANDTNLTGFGEGSRVRDRMNEMIAIRRDFIQKDDELRRQHQAGEIDDEFFNRAIALNKRYLDKRLSDQQMYYTSLDDQRNNWIGGMRDGFADWADDATDYATQASQGMKTAMSSAVGSITEMLNGNKNSWKDWGVGVLKIIQSVLINMAVANAANGASSIIGTVFGIGASAMAGGAGAASANNAFSTGAYSNLTFNALGGVYDSPSLSAYSGGVYSTPQMFAFAKGAGVFGEAGPEAIMPLTRAANGSLGVRAIMPDIQSTNSGGNVYVTINESGTASVSGNGDQNFAREFTQIIQREYRKLRDKDLSQNGVLNRAISGRR